MCISSEWLHSDTKDGFHPPDCIPLPRQLLSRSCPGGSSIAPFCGKRTISLRSNLLALIPLPTLGQTGQKTLDSTVWLMFWTLLKSLRTIFCGYRFGDEALFVSGSVGISQQESTL